MPAGRGPGWPWESMMYEGEFRRVCPRARPRALKATVLSMMISGITLLLALPPAASGAETVVPGTLWGVSETFWNITTGTHAPAVFNDVILAFSTETDSVVLDGWLYEMTKFSGTSTVARYAPEGPAARGDDWNISAEIVRPKEDSAYMSYAMAGTAGRQSLVVYLTDDAGTVYSAVSLTTGTADNESIQVYDARTHKWSVVSDDLLPSYPHDSDTFGTRPNRYIVSFAHANGSDEAALMVMSTAAGVVYAANHSVPELEMLNSPVLRFDCDVETGRISAYKVPSGWVIDNLMFRSMTSRYAAIDTVYEVVAKNEPLWLKVVDEAGEAVSDAEVWIGGQPAAFSMPSGRYEAYVPREVGWDVPIQCTVVLDGATLNDMLKVTTVSDPVDGVALPRWWNGWDWATVLGLDDATSVTSAEFVYSGYEHPKTSYMFNSFMGNSTYVLSTQSEIAIHVPHDFYVWGNRFWEEAVEFAEASHSTLDQYYWFSSRWDDPRYVGRGDTYISLATPGNAASWENVYAQYLHGTRLMGVSSAYYSPGNSSLLGSYWVHGKTGEWLPAWAAWHPHSRMDLMDMYRAISMDSLDPNLWNIARTVSSNAGALRIYTHWDIASPEFLRWVCDVKSNSTYENWKATDGEVASYVHGRLSTDIVLSPETGTDLLVLNISRRSPYDAGYWNVPVTVAVDMTDRELKDIEVLEGGTVVRMSDGTLGNIEGKRVMDVGWDLRGDTLYVSHFWNSSAVLRISSQLLLKPYITSTPPTAALAWGTYAVNLSATPPDLGSSEWAFETNASWLGVVSNNETGMWIMGVPQEQGSYWVKVRVWDHNTTDYMNWSIAVHRHKVLSGQVYDYEGEPLADLLVLLKVERGSSIRFLEYLTTDDVGSYSLTLTESEWAVGDRLVVSAVHNESSQSDSAVATKYPYQELDLRFEYGLEGEVILLMLLGIVAAIGIVAVVASRQKYK